MTDYEIREANRYYWIVKGQLIPESWEEAEVERIYISYFKRIWGNHENIVHETGFNAAYEERMQKELEKVAHLGYD